MEPGSLDASEILGITPQQLRILKAVYSLERTDGKASPSLIDKKCGGLHKSNLFRQLRLLVEKGFLVKGGEGRYSVDFSGIKDAINARTRDYEKGLAQYMRLSGEIEEYFRKATLREGIPAVEYLGYDELFARMTKSLSKAGRYLATGKFPNILYKRNLAKAIGRARFWDMLHRLCFDEGKEIVYLTGFDLDSPYTHALAYYEDPKRAYKETLNIVDGIMDCAERHPNLKLMYLEKPYGLDILIPETKALTEHYQFVRDDRMNITGGIHIRSPETTRQARETYENMLQAAILVAGKDGARIVKGLKRQLKERYR